MGQAPGAGVHLPAPARVDPPHLTGRGPLARVPGHVTTPAADFGHPLPEGGAVAWNEQVDHLVEEGHAHLTGVLFMVVGGKADDPLPGLAEARGRGEPGAPLDADYRSRGDPIIEVRLAVVLVQGLEAG